MKHSIRLLLVTLLSWSLFIHPIAPSDCESFLTCVNVPECSQNSWASTCLFGKTFFSIRPQDSNSALRIARIATEDHHKLWGLNLTFGQQQSFAGKNNVLARWFLFNGCTTVSVGVPNDTTTFDVDGRQLGLITPNGSAGLIGQLSLNPSIKNFSTVFNAWFDLNNYVCGLWLRSYLTLVQAKTKLGLHSSTSNAAQSGNYAEGDYTTACNTAPIRYTSISQAFIGDESFGEIPSLQFGKYYSDSKTKTAFASIRLDLNYDFVKSGDGFFNAGGCLVIPTGNKPEGHYVFEPIVGANKAWQLGGTVLSSYNVLNNSEKNALNFYIDATLTYLFKSQQTRLFTLKNNGAGSQYMLLKVFDLSMGAVLDGERVANVFAGESKIGSNIMFDGSLMMHFEGCNGVFFDIGYNLWARSREKIASTVCLRKFYQDTYGVKGNLPLTEVDVESQLCIGNLQTASTSTLGAPAGADATTKVLDVCDIDFNAPLNPSVFSNKLFGSLGCSHNLRQWNSSINIFLEGEAEFGQKNRALNQWALNVNVGISL